MQPKVCKGLAEWDSDDISTRPGEEPAPAPYASHVAAPLPLMPPVTRPLLSMNVAAKSMVLLRPQAPARNFTWQPEKLVQTHLIRRPCKFLIDTRKPV
jgi:hypothetical protein